MRSTALEAGSPMMAPALTIVHLSEYGKVEDYSPEAQGGRGDQRWQIENQKFRSSRIQFGYTIKDHLPFPSPAYSRIMLRYRVDILLTPERWVPLGSRHLGPACQPLQSGRRAKRSASMRVLMDCLQQALALSGAGWEGAGACKFSSRTCEWGLGPKPGHHCEELMEVRTRKSLLLPCPGSGTTKYNEENGASRRHRQHWRKEKTRLALSPPQSPPA